MLCGKPSFTTEDIEIQFLMPADLGISAAKEGVFRRLHHYKSPQNKWLYEATTEASGERQKSTNLSVHKRIEPKNSVYFVPINAVTIMRLDTFAALK